MLKHKLQWLLLLAALLGVSQGVWADNCQIRGSWDGWTDHDFANCSDATVTITLDAGTYDFGFDNEYNNWHFFNGTLTRASCTDKLFTTSGSTNAKITADVTGDYIFRSEWKNSGRYISVTYPCEPPTAGTAYVQDGSGNWGSSLDIHESSTVNLKVTGYTGGSSIQWQYSTDNSSWNDCAGETSSTASISGVNSTTYYRAQITNDGCSATTSAVTVTRKYRIRVKKNKILSSSAYIYIWDSGDGCNTAWDSSPAMTASDDGLWWFYDCSCNPSKILFKDATGNVTNGNHQTNDINRGSSSTDFCYEVTSNKTDGSSKQDVGTTSCCTAPTAADFAISENEYTYDGNAHRATVASNTEGYTPASITWGHGANSSSTTSNKTTAGTYGTYVLTASASGDYCAVISAISTSVGNLIIEKADQAALSISTTPTTTCMGNTFTLETSGGTDSGAVTYEIISGGSGSGSIDGTTLSASEAGTINVKATKAATTNYNAATAEQTFTYNANPSTPTIKSYTASVCSSGTPTFTVASSTGLTYQMYTGGSTSGSSVAGEDSKDKTLTAAAITSATSYVMRATDGNGCYAESDAASVTITPDMALTSITLTPSNICVGGTSVASETGLELGGGSIEYTASPAAKVSIDDREITGVAVADGITITATVSGGCGSDPDPKTATLNVKAAPTAYTLSASGESEAYICSAGGTLTLSGSQSGYSYQLKKDGSVYGDAKAGTGSALVFTVYESGDYTCEAYLTGSSDCKTSMTGTVTLHLSLTPALLPATPTVKNYEPVTITSINTDIETWTISNAGNTAYLYNITSNSATVKASKANSPYTVTATTPGGCSSTVTVTVGDYAETCN